MGHTSLPCPLAAVMLSATERAAKVAAIGIPWMGEKANSTLAAGDRALFPIGIFAQDRIQRQLILPNKRKGAIELVPIVAKYKEFRDGNYKNARFSVRISSGLVTSSSYTFDAKASTGRPRIFYALRQKSFLPIRATHRCSHPSPIVQVFSAC
jgi:hypothetical protein